MKIKYLLILGILLFSSVSMSQNTHVIVSEAERSVAKAYRIKEQPAIMDTIIPLPEMSYPLLLKRSFTDIQVEDIKAAKIKIKPNLDKLYRSYVKLGIGNYTSPLGEFYFNSLRNRRSSYGVHINHLSSFGQIPNYAPSQFDLSKARIFTEYQSSNFRLEPEFNYLNHGYHYYGLLDSAGLIPSDSLRGRVQGISGGLKFANVERRDSAVLLYEVYAKYRYFHEFNRQNDLAQLNARNGQFDMGAQMKFKRSIHVYQLDFDVRYNQYRYGVIDSDISNDQVQNYRNTLVHLRPTITSYGDRWKVIWGIDVNLDAPSNQTVKIVPIIEGKYSLLNNMFIPYAGINGGVNQNSFYSLNRQNEFILSSIKLLNTRLFNLYAGIKGTLSKDWSFNFQVHRKSWTDHPLFLNENIMQGQNRFRVIYDDISAIGGSGSLSYQKKEKLKVDLIGTFNQYETETELFAWQLPTLNLSLRAAYNLYDKLYGKLSLTALTGRKSPVYALNGGDQTIPVDLNAAIDANLGLEYRYNSRVSAFIEFNNFLAQKYQRWYGYPVQGFQVMGGVTLGF